MKGFISTLILVFFVMGAVAQGNFKVVQEQQAHYPGGEQALQDYFNLYLEYPQAALDQRVYGNVMMTFDVLPDSSIMDIIVLDGVGYGVDEAVVNMLQPLHFAPAVSNGVVIRSTMVITVNVKAIPRPELEIEKE